MSEVGTLSELGVEAGDVVRVVGTWNGVLVPHGAVWRIHRIQDDQVYGTRQDYEAWHTGTPLSVSMKFRIISRANNEHKLWRDMTPEEKGALLLAAHEGKVIENKGPYSDWIASEPCWADEYAYRIKTEPKVETVTLNGNDIRFCGFIKGHRITFNTINGKPDCASIKMEAI